MTIRRTFVVLAAAATLLAGAASASAAAATPRTSLTAIWNDVMCVSCREPLSVAQSPQAYAERSFIRGLVAQGYTKAQIERALVAQYGPSVLGKPPARGFNLTVYVLPPAIFVAGIGILIVTLPRWRRRARARAPEQAPSSAAALSPADQRRLDEELGHFAG